MMSETELHLLANYPILYIISPEEDRFLGEIENLCIKYKRRLWIHTISEGLWNIAFSQLALWPEKKKGRVMKQLRDPIALLEYIKQAGTNEGIFLLLDFHEVLRDALVRRLLRDVSRRLKENRNSIVILAPMLELPRELEHDVTVLDFPLPAKDYLGSMLGTVLQTLKSRNVEVYLGMGEKERLITAGQGLTMNEFESCLAKAVVKNRKVDSGIIDEIMCEKKQLLKKSGLLEFFDTSESIKQIGGLSVLKEWLSKRQLAFTEKARFYGLPTPKGMLLLGVQGCGKSLTAKACASLWKFPLLRLDTGRLFSSQVGSSEDNARRAIRIAQALAPCILWIDEIEKAMAGTGSSSYSDAGTAARVFATLATWLQEKTTSVFVIATANSVTSLPPELLRKGRWDEIFFLDLPGEEERRSIFHIHLMKRNRNPRDFDVQILAKHSSGYSGAEIESAIESGLYDSFDEERPLNTEDILKNLKEQIPLSTTMEEQVEALRAWARTRARFASEASENMIEEKRRQWRNRDLRKI